MNELIPSGECSRFSAGAMLFFKCVKFMSRNKFQHMMEKCVIMSHSSNSPFCLVCYVKYIITELKENSNFFNTLTGQ